MKILKLWLESGIRIGTCLDFYLKLTILFEINVLIIYYSPLMWLTVVIFMLLDVYGNLINLDIYSLNLYTFFTLYFSSS